MPNAQGKIRKPIISYALFERELEVGESGIDPVSYEQKEIGLPSLTQREQLGLFDSGMSPAESAHAQKALEAASKAYNKAKQRYVKKRRGDKDVHQVAFEAAKAAATKILIDAYVKQKGVASRFLLKQGRVMRQGGVPQKILDIVLRAMGQKSIAGIPVNKLLGIREQVAKTKAILSEYKRDAKMRDRAAKDLNKIKDRVMIEMRKLMPKGNTVYTAKEITALFKVIREAKTLDGIDKAIDQVMEMMMTKITKMTQAEILKALEVKTFRSQGQRKISASLFVNQQETMEMLNKWIADENFTLEKIEDKIAEMERELYPDNETKHFDTLAALEIMRMYKAALNLNDGSPGKLNDMVEVLASIKHLIETGQSLQRQAAAQRSAEYSAQAEMLYADIMGNKLRVSLATDYANLTHEQMKMLQSLGIDPDQLSADVKLNRGNIKKLKELAGVIELATPKYSELTEAERAQKAVELQNKNTRRQKIIRKFFLKMSEWFSKRDNSLPYLIDIISKTGGEMMGGNAQELITDRFNDSSYLYKAGIEEMYKEVEEMMEKFFGKGWKSINKKNREIGKLGIWITSEAGRSEVQLSPDQMAYLYNQYKNPETHPAFESAGLTPDIMARITAKLENDHPQLKAWADWQVEEFFPRLYEKYNQVYREIYGTNMPWSMQYAGKLFRDGDLNEVLDILASGNKFQQSIGSPGSSLMRQKSSAPIMKTVSINDALLSYLNEMEYFKAYARNLKDINKLLKNKDIIQAIELNDPDIINLLHETLTLIARRGVLEGKGVELIDKLTNAFVTSRLGLNPSVGVKQITSAFTYSNDIGLDNWLLYSAKTLPKALTIWDEIYANSPYIRARYGRDIRKAIESYSEKAFEAFDPTAGWFNVRTVIDGMMQIVKTGDKMGIMGGIPNYMYYKDQYMAQNPGASEQEAIKYAIKLFTRDTKLTQQSSDIVDKSWYQQQGGAVRFFNMFKSAIKGYTRKVEQSIRQLSRAAKGEPYKGNVKGLVYQAFLYHTFLPTVFQYVALWFPGLLTKWDDEDEESLMAAALIGNINSLFIAGDFAKAGLDYIQKKPWGEAVHFGPFQHLYKTITLPLIDFFTALGETGNKAQEDMIEAGGKVIVGLIEARGFALTAGIKWAKNLYKVVTGDTKNAEEVIMRLLNAGEYWIGGGKKPAKKKKSSKSTGSKKGGYTSPIKKQKGGSTKGGYSSPIKNKKGGSKKGGYKSPIRT